MLAVVQDALQQLAPRTPDAVVLLQPTQPLRRPEHVHAALRLLEETGADSVASVVRIPPHYSPDYAMTVKEGRLMPFLAGRERTRRQDTRPAYSRDGTVYVMRREVILGGSLYGNCQPLLIPHSESVNLDTEDDWQRAEEMKERSHGQR
jgi:CMP-N-acetylneuraminic acid synthetase